MLDTPANVARSVIEITPTALEKILELRTAEANPDDLGLGLRVAGVTPNGFTYETAFLAIGDFGEADIVEDHGGLSVAIPPDSVDSLNGAVLDLSADPNEPGLVIRNPNPATPGLGTDAIPDLDPASPEAAGAE